MKNKLFMFAINQTNGKRERFYFIGGQTIQQHNQIIINLLKKEKIYITTMYRYANREYHSYVVYAGFDKLKAIETGKEIKDYRGGKYDPEIIEFIPDDPKSRKIIYKLKEY